MQSGNGTGAFDIEQAARVTHRVGLLLDREPSVAALARLSDVQLVELGAQLTGIDLRTFQRFDPLVGLSPFSLVLERQPADSVAAGSGAQIPLLIGTNSEEGNLYLAPRGALAGSTEADARELAERSQADPDAVVTELPARQPGWTWGQILSALLGEALFGAGTRRLVDAYRSGSAAALHQYLFGWRSSAPSGRLGAAHAVELPFVFDCLDQRVLRGADGLLGPAAVPQVLATQMHKAWVDYATTGDPRWHQADQQEFVA